MTLNKFLKFLASLKLAVLVILGFVIITAVGTFVESRYDMNVAAKLVYKTPWMFGVLGLLAINLTAVMVDRWPWKKKHLPFLMAHSGILILLLGSYVTYRLGIDGTMRLGLGQTSNRVMLSDTEIKVFASFDGERFQTVFIKPVDFFTNDPKKDPLPIPIAEDFAEKSAENFAKVTDYWPFASAFQQTVLSTSERDGAGVRFQIYNSKVNTTPKINTTQWLLQNNSKQAASYDLGPARFYLGPFPAEMPKENALYMKTSSQSSIDRKSLDYVVTYADGKKKPLKGQVSEGEIIPLGWMDLEFKILRFLPHAEEKWDFKKLDRPTANSTSVVKIEWRGQDYWLQLGDVVKYYTKDTAYFISYGNKMIDLDFKLTLNDFQVGRYQGTMRAASYKSKVNIQDQDYEISMNEPLKYGGYTFYQSSFQDGLNGRPEASILSVNKDPGRWIKYFGCLLISLGMILLYYNKRKVARASAPLEGVLK